MPLGEASTQVLILPASRFSLQVQVNGTPIAGDQIGSGIGDTAVGNIWGQQISVLRSWERDMGSLPGGSVTWATGALTLTFRMAPVDVVSCTTDGTTVTVKTGHV